MAAKRLSSRPKGFGFLLSFYCVSYKDLQRIVCSWQAGCVSVS